MRRDWGAESQVAYGRLSIPYVREIVEGPRRLYTLANADGRVEDMDEH